MFDDLLFAGYMINFGMRLVFITVGFVGLDGFVH